MSRKQNAYLAKQEQRQSVRDMIVREWTRQVDRDAITLVLGDPAVVNKDTFGEVRLDRVLAAFDEVTSQIELGLSNTPEASYVRAQTDREVEKRRKKRFISWPGRYLYWDDRGI